MRESAPPTALSVEPMAGGAAVAVGTVVASAVALAVGSLALEARRVRGLVVGDAADRCLGRGHGRLGPEFVRCSMRLSYSLVISSSCSAAPFVLRCSTLVQPLKRSMALARPDPGPT